VESARRIQSVLRPEDSVARFGGDEFVLLCEAMGQHAASELADRLVRAFEAPMALAGTTCRVGVSVGFALADRPGTTTEELVAAADERMYRHKRRAQSVAGSGPARGDKQPIRARTSPVGTAGDYQLTLYVAGAGTRSDLALQDVERLCEEHLPPGAYVLTPVDVLEAPELAAAAHVLVTPTLVRDRPLPALRVVGDLSSTSRIAEALDLPRSTHG
jgi:circadian clock protein KaiB